MAKATSKKATEKKRKKVLVTFKDQEVDLFERYQEKQTVETPEGLLVKALAVERMQQIFGERGLA